MLICNRLFTRWGTRQSRMRRWSYLSSWTARQCWNWKARDQDQNGQCPFACWECYTNTLRSLVLWKDIWTSAAQYQCRSRTQWNHWIAKLTTDSPVGVWNHFYAYEVLQREAWFWSRRVWFAKKSLGVQLERKRWFSLRVGQVASWPPITLEIDSLW